MVFLAFIKIKLYNKKTKKEGAKMKICKECKRRLPINEFHVHYYKSRNYYNITNYCITCYGIKKKEWDKKYRIKNFEKLKQKRSINREKRLEYCKKWHKENKEKEKEYREKTKEQKAINTKIWYDKNKKKIQEYHKQYKRKARKNELIYMKDRIRNMISHSFRRKNYTKRSKTYNILGANYDFVWNHLKNTWYINYGTKYNGEEYQIDHIVPLATAESEEDIIKLCHYSNLQMLTPEDNLKKNARID